ncbi:SpoIIE family protein phosphatase [Streptomyces sp. NPDC048389]|uniref:SpoIIE family protein phosphatase n=1 Tax=Streptomyces sp. NPDC048389 TaxID=3154622 RepID=UPI003452F7EE
MGAIPMQRETGSRSTSVWPARPDAGLVAHTSLPGNLLAPAAGRRFVHDAVAEWTGLGFLTAGRRADRLAEDAAVVVSELVTNAVVHAGTAAELLCRFVEPTHEEPAALVVEVSDHHPASGVTAATHSADQPGTPDYGRGLHLVASLADRWGVTFHAALKTVWARLPLDGREIRPPAAASPAPSVRRGTGGVERSTRRRTGRDDPEWVSRGAPAFLAEASELLAGQLDEEMVAALAGQLLVPRLADRCAIWLDGEGKGPGGGGAASRLVGVWHSDESRVEPLRDALGKEPPLLPDAPDVGPVRMPWPDRPPTDVIAVPAPAGVSGLAGTTAALLVPADAAGPRPADPGDHPGPAGRGLRISDDSTSDAAGSPVPLAPGPAARPSTAGAAGSPVRPAPGLPSRSSTAGADGERGGSALPGVEPAGVGEAGPGCLPGRAADWRPGAGGPPDATPADPGADAATALAYPLSAGGRRLGVLVVAQSGDEYLPAEVAALIEDFARRVALAVGAARRYARQATISRVLQRGLLPSRVGRIPGVDTYLVYEPSDDGVAGGDFYDVFPAGAGGRWCFMLGDVQGSGPEAAVVTGLARPWLRLLAREGYEVGQVLDRLNGLLLDDAMEAAEATALLATGGHGPGLPEGRHSRFLSLLYGEVVPSESGAGGARCTLASAGHPLPLVLRPDGTVRVHAEPQVLLGVVEDVAYHSHTFDLEPGDTLLCVTDGVTERRSGPRMFDDEDGLAQALSECAGLAAQGVAERIRAAVHEFAPTPPGDDLALLVLQAGWSRG